MPRAEAWAVSEVLRIHRGETPLKIISDASYVCRGFDDHNRAKYMKGPNADIWGRIYSRMDELRIKPTLHKVKSHITIEEIMVCCERNKDIDKRVISNEAADAAAGAIADHQGDHKETLDSESKATSQLWAAMKRISAIELDIRLKDEGVPMTAENVIAAAEAMTSEWCNADNERAKRRLDQLIERNGHRLDTMPRVREGSRRSIRKVLVQSELQPKQMGPGGRDPHETVR